jgi:CO dehydrogenase maturation factor
MAAGIEHLGRATAKAVDKLIVVVEPGRKSIETAFRIKKLAQDIGLSNIAAVGNKIRDSEDRDFMINGLKEFEFLGFIPYDTAILDAEISNGHTLDASQPVSESIKSIYNKLSVLNVNK